MTSPIIWHHTVIIFNRNTDEKLSGEIRNGSLFEIRSQLFKWGSLPEYDASLLLFLTETKAKHWLEKSEMVRFLEEVGARNRTAFNRAVIRECGVVVGFLQRPIDEVVTLG